MFTSKLFLTKTEHDSVDGLSIEPSSRMSFFNETSFLVDDARDLGSL